MSVKIASKRWISEESTEEVALFQYCAEIDKVCFALNRVLLDAETKWKGWGDKSSGSLSNRNYIVGLVNIQVLDQIIDYLYKLVKSLYKLNPMLARLKKDSGLSQSKHDHIFDKLCSSRFVMLQSIKSLIETILSSCLHREDVRKIIESALRLVDIYNQMTGLSFAKFAAKFNVCSNTYPNVIAETKPVTLTKIVQTMAKSRSEINCHRLINCLIKIYKTEQLRDNESSASTSESIEIYHTLTKHITPPTSTVSRQLTSEKRREAFIEHKKAKFRQAKSLVDVKKEPSVKCQDIIALQNSDCEISYTSLLQNGCIMEKYGCDASKRWISEESTEEVALFQYCAEIDKVCFALNRVLLDAETKWKGWGDKSSGSLSNRNYIVGLVNIQVLDQIIDYLYKLVKSLYKLNPMLARLKKDSGLSQSKHDHIFDKLCSSRFVMLQSIKSLIETILSSCLHREDVRKIIESALRLVDIYNQMTGLSFAKFAAKFNVCSNTYPNVIAETKPVTLTKIVQTMAKSRSEINCHRLINCLIKIYKTEQLRDNESSASTSESIEIYHTLTKHITPPTSTVSRQLTSEKRREAFIEHKKAKFRQAKSLVDVKKEPSVKCQDIIALQNSDCEISYTSLLQNGCIMEKYGCDENVNSILQSEEVYIEILLDTVANMSPTLLGENGVKTMKLGRVCASKKAARKVTEYYQSVLWGDVGCCLEHIVLWWSSCPLATRSPTTSQNLREWLFLTFNLNNTPELILAALRILADALGCHVASTSWDRNFGSSLKTNLKPTSLKMRPELSLHITECTTSGANFAMLLQELVVLSNQCEVTGEYIMGAPLEDLPIVEQIPILHRLDHSVHSYRLWCLAETRRLADLWEMDDFFRITHNDMQTCMEQLVDLRFADHSVTIESGKIGVHENVCAKMREKLVSEVKVNIQKLKDATEEITGVLSSICTTLSLAHLTMVFPSHSDWRDISDPPDARHTSYVKHFLDQMILPVIKATGDTMTHNMILRIICESWLHHIYVSKVKFSKDAAIQLLSDFNAVRTWLTECKLLTETARKHLLQNEVLRRCEGVGRLLLHAPGDLISMQDSTLQTLQQSRKDDANEAQEQLMPAEMYVPNQKQWLTLRAKTMKGPLTFGLCCIVFV